METYFGKPCKHGHSDGNGKNERMSHNGMCLACHRENNRERARRPEVRARNIEAQRAYRERHPRRAVESQLKYRKKRLRDDPYFALVDRLRSRVRRALGAGYSKGGDGIDYAAIARHLGPKPGDGYHVDHILPLCQFDLSQWDQVLRAFAPENHRWLKAGENLKRPKTGGDLKHYQHTLPLGIPK